MAEEEVAARPGPAGSDACAEAVVRAYAWWEMMRARQLALQGPRQPAPQPSNRFQHSAALITHRHRGVTTPNADTLYSAAWMDLSGGPVLLDVPASDLAYWSIAVMNLHTDHDALIGPRDGMAAADGSRRLALCPPGHTGPVPAGARRVQAATRVVWLLGRYLTGDEPVRAKADALRRAVTLRRVGPDGSVGADAAVPTAALPAAQRRSTANFLLLVNLALAEDAALAGPDSGWMPRGMGPQAEPFETLDAPQRAAWEAGFAAALARIDDGRRRFGVVRNGWGVPVAGIGNFGTEHLHRAAVALWGLGALEVHEALYANAATDAHGAPLRGSGRYRLRIPPEGIACDSFWSLSMYEIDPAGGLYFTDNPIGRYAIGDRTTGLVRAADGSLEVHIGHAEPTDPLARANWLPAPKGAFRMSMRAYWPRPELADGRAVFPALQTLQAAPP